MDLCPEHFLTSASVGHLITLYEMNVLRPVWLVHSSHFRYSFLQMTPPDLVRPLDEVRIEDVAP